MLHTDSVMTEAHVMNTDVAQNTTGVEHLHRILILDEYEVC